MSLTLVAIPIGDPQDITLRALEALKGADICVGEDAKPARAFLKSVGILHEKPLYFLNEHSSADDLKELLEFCRTKNVVLFSDCGTPSFCDPGFQLVALCRREKVLVRSLPGASSLMCILSMSSVRLEEFVFRGFLPAKTEDRARALKELTKEKRPFILMDTPYRLQKTLAELKEAMPKRLALLGANLTQENEVYIEATLEQLPRLYTGEKAEFMLLVY